MGQSSIFEFMYDAYKITKPVRIIELFAGYGSQHLALTYLGVDVKGHKIVEWAVPSIQAYKDLHYGDVNIDHTKELTDDEIVDALADYGISANYNEPMTLQQIKRKGSQWCRNVYNNIKNTNNLVNISNVKATDLEITETDKYDYILTYSFPCQDLSLAGKRLGMDEDSGTRSSLLWQVQRLLDELKELNQLPHVLLMENVPQVMAQDNMRNMEKWDHFLSLLGYKSYIKNLIATDYGIPQIRNRTFMISILGDYVYTFPSPIPLELKLSDMLEDEVDAKHYLGKKGFEFVTNPKYKNRARVNKPIIQTQKANQQFNWNGDFVFEKYEKVRERKDVLKRAYVGTFNGQKGVIRQLSYRECFRLMGVKDEDYDKIAKNQSDSSLYHLAGDSIVVNVLMAIFKQLL